MSDSAAQADAASQPERDPDRDPRPPGAGLNLQDAAVVADLFQRAAEAQLESPLRRGATVHLPANGRLVVSGDLHDNGLNFARLLNLAALHKDINHHLILQEVVHGPNRINNCDMSVRTLARVAALVTEYPMQAHVVLGNHELAQYVGGAGILKDGVSVTELFDEGMEYIYGNDTATVRQAMFQFIRSQALAVRCPRGILCTHSLPSAHQVERFDPTVLDRVPTDEDLRPGGSGYMLVWGRNQPQDLTDRLAQAWGVRLFLVGHQPAYMGYEVMTRNMLVLNSDHEHGMALPLDLSKRYDLDDLIAELVPLASVVV